MFLLAYPIMHAAIEFDHQAELMAIKIGDVAIDRVLATKLVAIQLPVFKSFPE
jgi:hypothetical protein